MSPASARPLTGDDAIARFRELLPAFRSAMLVTHTLDGADPHARPMGLVGDPATFEGTLWFFSDERSPKIAEIARQPRASLILQSDSDHAYLHVLGWAWVVDDRARMRELYSPILRTWFPDGLDDPHLTLIGFDVERAEYWNSPGGMLQMLGAFTKAIITGRPGQGGEQGTLEL
ncbi:MAG: pyridoxamine 5'-phosphate oxidase family protein [Vicinamibacteraceae bacterium]